MYFGRLYTSDFEEKEAVDKCLIVNVDAFFLIIQVRRQDVFSMVFGVHEENFLMAQRVFNEIVNILEDRSPFKGIKRIVAFNQMLKV